jgi:hypothetical protein
MYPDNIFPFQSNIQPEMLNMEFCSAYAALDFNPLRVMRELKIGRHATKKGFTLR